MAGLLTIAAWQLARPNFPAAGMLAKGADQTARKEHAAALINPVTQKIFVTSNWQRTNFVVEQDRCYRLAVTGECRDKTGVRFGPEGTCPIMLQPVLGPQPNLPADTRGRCYVGQHPFRTMIARIADKSWSFRVGSDLTFIAPDSGVLSLRINEPENSGLNPEGTLTCTLQPILQPRFVDDAGRTSIWARVDAIDILLVSPRGLQWEYGGNWARVGLHEGVFPTLVNGIAWWPIWLDPMTSSTLETGDFAPVADVIARGEHGVRVIDIMAQHGQVSVERPVGDVARIQFYDRIPGSSDIGCTFALLGTGSNTPPNQTEKESSLLP